MTRERRYLISAAVLSGCVGIVLGVLVILPPRPGVTKANVDRVKLGMTREEVQAIFGYEGVTRPGVALGWQNDNGAYVECHFHHDKVITLDWSPSRETIFDMFHRWRHGPGPKIEPAD